MSDYEIKTYGCASVYIESGMYSKKEIEDYLKYFEVMEQRAKELVKDIRHSAEDV